MSATAAVFAARTQIEYAILSAIQDLRGNEMDLVPDKSSTGMEPNVAAGVAMIHWIAGVIFMSIEKESKFVKFYAWQSLILGLSFLLGPIPVIGWIYAIFALVMWIICLINAFGGKIFKVPVIGNIAAKQAGLE
jgi:uncharacterized membrane protein